MGSDGQNLTAAAGLPEGIPRRTDRLPSIGDLVDCMGIGRGSMYDTFGSKHGLFVCAVRFYIESYDRSLQEFLNQSPTAPGAIIGMFEDAAANGPFVVAGSNWRLTTPRSLGS